MTTVALRKESVDRNVIHNTNDKQVFTSLSARRAWIEIIPFSTFQRRSGSLSARRAWIEIPVSDRKPVQRRVALRKESVDRNL